jgi:predicted ATPase
MVPLLLIAEDAQWLDRPSCDVLAFVARRLTSDPIVFLAAIRDGHNTPLDKASVSELRLEGLDNDAAAALVDGQAPDLGSEERKWMLEEAAGNPLALLELSSALASDQSANRAARSPLLRAARLEQVFTSRIRDLPARTRTVLLVASADESGRLTEVPGAASVVAQSDVTFDTLQPPIAARLINIEDGELPHPVPPSGRPPTPRWPTC